MVETGMTNWYKLGRYLTAILMVNCINNRNWRREFEAPNQLEVSNIKLDPKTREIHFTKIHIQLTVSLKNGS